MAKFIAPAVIMMLWLSGCASIGAPGTPGTATVPALASGTPHFRCDHGIVFTVRFTDDTAVLDAGPQGRDVLLRDAGGSTPQQTVYSNSRMRAEFGLGATGREAMLRYASPPLAAHCVLQ